jgi:nitrogen fixation/metabolism regulation signal transduction histidine kinase
MCTLLTIAIFIAAASVCIHHAFRPIMNVTDAMDAVSSGDFSIQLPLCGQSEIRRLIAGLTVWSATFVTCG